MNRSEGYTIPPHEHNHVLRTIVWTQEVLLIRSGKVRLDLYDPGTQKYIESIYSCLEMSYCLRKEGMA